MVTIEDIYEAYFDCRKNKRSSCNALSYELEYEDNLHTLLEEINNRTYEIGRSICFIVDHPKKREVFAADFRDRIVHHLVVRKIEPFLEDVFIEDTYNCRAGRGTLYGISRLEKKIREVTKDFSQDAYIGKFDCKNFFMSIHKPTLWSMLESFIKDKYNGQDKEDILWLTKKIVLHCPNRHCVRRSDIRKWDALDKGKSLFTSGDDCGLPIGNLSSQIFANFYLLEFDRMMLSIFGNGYGRYVDDFFVIANDKRLITSSLPIIKDKLREYNIELHPKKIYIQHYSKGVKFTGAVVKMSRRYIGNSLLHTFSRKIKRFNGFEVKTIASAYKFFNSINSYLGFMRQYMSYGLRVKLLNSIDKEWRKYMYISGRYEKMVIRNKYKKAI